MNQRALLKRREREVLDTLLPSGIHPQLPWGIFEADFDGFYRRFLETADISWRFGFRAALFVAIWIAPLLIFRFPPITLYDRPAREQALLALYASRFNLLRQMVLVLKAVVCFCYGADPRVREVIGYPRPVQPDCLPERVGATA